MKTAYRCSTVVHNTPKNVFKNITEISITTTTTVYGPLSGVTPVSRYQKRHSPIHTYPDNQPSIICFLHQLRSIASSLFNLYPRQSFCTTSLQVLFGLTLGLAHSTSYSMHFFTQSLSSFCNTCPYHRNRFAVACHLILVC